jgi:hypothetical protein
MNNITYRISDDRNKLSEHDKEIEVTTPNNILNYGLQGKKKC